MFHLGFFIQARINISYGNGVLDGETIDWSLYRRYGVIDTVVWILCLLFPFALDLFFKNKKKLTGRILAALAVFLTVIQIPGFVVRLADYKPNANTSLMITTDGMFDISDKENVIIFVLDTMGENYYRDFIEDNPEYAENLDGFVHYDNTLASGARTFIGVPSMFTGIPFDRSVEYPDYLKKIWGGENPLRILHDETVVLMSRVQD